MVPFAVFKFRSRAATTGKIFRICKSETLSRSLKSEAADQRFNKTEKELKYLIKITEVFFK